MTYIENAPQQRLPAAPPADLVDPFGFGIVFADFPIVNSVGAWPSANWGVYLRVLSGGTISKLRYYLGTASGNVCAAVYENVGAGLSAAPGGRLITSGSVAVAATGGNYQDVALGASITVRPGQHWLFLGFDNVTVTVGRLTNQTLTSNVFAGQKTYQTASFPAPAIAAPTAAGALIFPPALIGVP